MERQAAVCIYTAMNLPENRLTLANIINSPFGNPAKLPKSALDQIQMLPVADQSTILFVESNMIEASSQFKQAGTPFGRLNRPGGDRCEGAVRKGRRAAGVCTE